MNVLGVDPGLYKIGYGIVKCTDDNFVVLASGILNIPKKLSVSKKLAFAYNFFNKLIDDFLPKVLCVESPFIYKNPKVTYRLIHIVSIIHLIAGQRDLEIVEIVPAKVRKVIVGFGSANKEQVSRHLVDLIGGVRKVDYTDGIYDDSDALAVAASYFFM